MTGNSRQVFSNDDGGHCWPVLAKIAHERGNDCLAAIAEEVKLTDEGLVILHQSLLVA
jgi:hypothetical protein